MRIEILEPGKDMFGILLPGEIYTIEAKENDGYTFWGKGYRFRIYNETIEAGKARIIDEQRKECDCYEPNKYGHYSWCWKYGK